MSEPRDSDETSVGDAGSEALSHLQTAAIELIAAGRSFLDAADAAIRSDDPGRVVRGLADLGRDLAARAAEAAAQASGPAPRRHDGDPADDYVDIPLDD